MERVSGAENQVTEFRGFIIGEQDKDGFSDITCKKCGVTLNTLTKHMDIVKTLRCSKCGFKSTIKSDTLRTVKK